MNAPYSETLFLTCGTQEVLKWAASKSGSKTKDKIPSVGTAPRSQAGRKGDRKWLGLQEVRWSTGSTVVYRKCGGLQEVGWPTGSGLAYRKWVDLQEVWRPTGSGLAYRKWSHLFSLPLGMTARRSVLLRSLQTYVFLRVIPADAAVL